MEIILEPIDAENTGEEIASTDADDPPPPVALARAPSVLPLTTVPEPDVPVKRPRGRPKGSAKPKEAPKVPKATAPKRRPRESDVHRALLPILPRTTRINESAAHRPQCGTSWMETTWRLKYYSFYMLVSNLRHKNAMRSGNSWLRADCVANRCEQ